jgi:hypothetical protein
MEKQKLEKLFEKTRTLSLTDDERAVARQRVLSFIKTAAARKSGVERRIQWSDVALHPSLPLKLKYSMPILLILALLASGGGVSYAAQGSLPGDTLYPVKISINEPVVGALRIGAQAQAQWNLTLAQTRLQEAERLAAQNKLTPQLQAQIATRLEKAVAAAQKNVAQLQKKNNEATAAQIDNDLETALQVHAAILTRLAERHQTEGTTQSIIDAALTQAQKIASANEQRDANAALQAQSNGPQASQAVVHKHDEVQKFVDGVNGLFAEQKGSLDATTTANVQTSLTLAQQKIAAGDAAKQAEKYAEAFVDYQDAQRAAQEAKVLIVSARILRAEFEGEFEGENGHAASSSESGNASGQQNESGNQEQNMNASSSDKNREMEQNQQQDQNRFVPLPPVKNGAGTASTSVNVESQLNVGGGEMRLNVSGTTSGGGR